ncbi:MAG: D-alanyl-D-alanine carboxypeptidase family protein [Eubacterium sp.]|jgi:D-alanyl-D-alanine carboxypeptidase (penicillin-binding protein 5/6)
MKKNTLKIIALVLAAAISAATVFQFPLFSTFAESSSGTSTESSDSTTDASSSTDSSTTDATATEDTTDETVPEPEITAGSAVIYCRNTGETLYEKNGDARYSPYSITKLMTALLAAQKLPLDQEVTISENAASVGESSMNLVEGEVVTVEQLLYGLLLMSGNDAAVALAEAVSGSEEAFIELMNETAANIGCTNTHFANTNGLSNDVSTHYTSANDMVKICKLAFANVTIREIAGTEEYIMPATNKSESRDMVSHIPVLAEDREGTISGKTGYWDDDNSTIAVDYIEKGLEFIIVILGENIDKRQDECDALITYATANLKGYTVVEAGTVEGTARVKHGQETKVDAVAGSDCVVYLPKQGSKELITTEVVLDTDTEAPVEKGQKIGTLNVYIAGEISTKVDLVAAKAISVGMLPSYIGIPDKTTKIICVVALIIVVFILVRVVNKIRYKRKKRKAHKEKVFTLAMDEFNREQNKRQQR